MTVQTYAAFLEAKVRIAAKVGFDVEPRAFHPRLKDHQRAICRWAVRGGRRAIFSAFGLGKTGMQLETVRETLEHAGGQGLIIAPLGVRTEFFREAEALGLTLRFIRSADEIDRTAGALHLTNYETVRDGRLDPNEFTVVSLDEASVLRSYGSKTYQTFLALFEAVPFRFVATATPSPNRLKELIHYAGFLGVMDTGEALTRFFQRDSEKANNLTLYPHKEREFWLWCNSWAVFLQTPSDLGFSDEGYTLPPLDVRYHEVETKLFDGTFERDGQGSLLRNDARDLAGAAREKRDTLGLRVARTAALVAEAPEEHFLLWHDLEDERRALERALPGIVTIYGSQDLEAREASIVDFSEGRIRLFGAKPIIAGSGCNFQRHCRRAVFVGVGFKFNDFIQAVHRIQRFGQVHPVRIDVVHAESEREVLRTLRAKWVQHREMMETMSAIIREHGLEQLNMADEMRRSIGVVRRAATGEGWRVANNDCVDETAAMADDSVDLIVTSIPFANHYEYTPSYNDFGHTDNNDHFWRQMDFLTPQLRRVLSPGRIYACHVKDRILFGSVTGEGRPTVSPFHAEGIFHGMKHGLQYLGMITVVTDVVFENNGNYRLGYTEMLKDSTKMGVGSPEYVLLFAKPQSDRSRGYADRPVAKTPEDYSLARWQLDAHAFWRSSGDRLLTAGELASLPTKVLARVFPKETLKRIYDYREHVAIGEALGGRGCLPTKFMALAPGSADPDVWHDVVRLKTLNGNQASKGREKHICLARGSLVLTAMGHRPIEDVRVGDLVLTHKGRWRPVELVRNTGIRPVVTVRAQGVPGLTLTPEHKLWTRKVRDVAWARQHSRLEASRTEPDWVRADETAGSYLNLKLAPVEAVPGLSATDWWIVGRWIADGHFDSRGAAHISCGAHKLETTLQILGDRAGFIHEGTTAPQIRLKDRSGALRAVLHQCGHGAGAKRLPPAAYGMDAEKAMSLLGGYLAGDGHFQEARQRWTASSISKELMLGLAMLVQRVIGAVASIHPGKAAGQSFIEGRTVDTRAVWVLSFDMPRDEGNRTPFVMDDGAWKKVRSVEEAGAAETWCLRVAEDESFTAEGCIVKNCPLQFDIVDRLIERYSMRGETVFDPFGGLFTVPFRAMHLGRRGVAVELNEGYFQDGVSILEAKERELAVPTLLQWLEAAGAMEAA